MGDINVTPLVDVMLVLLVIFIIAAIVTPTPDPITQTMFAIPLYLLYEIAIIASARVEKRKNKLNLFGQD